LPGIGKLAASDINAKTQFHSLDISPKMRDFVLRCRLIMDISKEADLSKPLVACHFMSASARYIASITQISFKLMVTISCDATYDFQETI
jgi:hypothetical protein